MEHDVSDRPDQAAGRCAAGGAEQGPPRSSPRRASAAVPALGTVLGGSPSAAARRNAVWALTRIDSARARETVRTAFGDRDESVRRAAIYSAGLWRDGAAMPQLVAALQSGQPAVQRVAAEALGRIGDARAVPQLIAASAATVDRVLEHSLTYALIEIGDPASTAAGLSATASGSRRAALVALDQIDGGQLKPEGLIPLFTSSDAVLSQTAWWIAGRHPEWGGALAAFFETRLAAGDLRSAERDTACAEARAVRRVLLPFRSCSRVRLRKARLARRVIALRAMAASASSTAPRRRE